MEISYGGVTDLLLILVLKNGYTFYVPFQNVPETVK